MDALTIERDIVAWASRLGVPSWLWPDGAPSANLNVNRASQELGWRFGVSPA